MLKTQAHKLSRATPGGLGAIREVTAYAPTPSFTAADGVCHRLDLWHIDDGNLKPLGYKYQVPGKTARQATRSGIMRPGRSAS
jgi:hypothetical protein